MIVKFSELPRLRRTLRGKKIVYAGGTFDLVHNGHIEALKNLRKFGDIVVIAVSSDTRVRQRKGWRRPILSQRERLACMDAIRYVDYSLIAPEPPRNKPVPTIRILAALRPDIFVSADKRWLPFRREIEKLGVRLMIIPRNRINSTTRIINKILRIYGKTI